MIETFFFFVILKGFSYLRSIGKKVGDDMGDSRLESFIKKEIKNAK